MRIKLTFLRSRVARRVFVRFILAALIPVAAITLLVVKQTRDTLAEQSYVQLRAASKAIGQSIYERLLFIDRATEEMVVGLREARTSAEQIRRLEIEYFHDVVILANSREAVAASGESNQPPASESAAKHLAAGGVLLAWSNTPENQPILLISRWLDTANPELGMFVAEVNLDYLWGDPDSLPFVMDFCILETLGKIVYCSASGARAIAEQMPSEDAGSAQGYLFAQYNDENFLASYGQVFLARRYLSPNWIILAVRAQADILAPIAAFNTILVPVILLSVLLVAFLSVTQIRKILVPLDRLIRGTRRIASREFDSVIDVSSDDEFEELAISMNRMARNLGNQFETLQTLSEVDRLILSRADIETVLETVLARMRIACHYTAASLTIVDDDSDTAARVFIDGVGEELAIERIILSERQRKLFSDGNTRVFDAKDDHDGFLRPLVNLGARSFFVLPIFLNRRLSAIISLGYSDASVPPDNELTQVKDFADRVVVAIRAAERDEQLYRQAHYDPLTALPNRQLFKDRLQQSVAHAHRENRRGALLFIDLDHFKVVNDSEGHTVGDELLKQAARRLQSYVREADTVARLGGDEFTVVLSKITSPQDVSRVANKLVELLSEPFRINKRDQFISASIGVTIFPDDGMTVEDLLKNADTAMYRAKASGRCRHTFFTEQMNVEAINRHQLESDLRIATEQDQFFLEYQPQVELDTQRVIGAEALIRWRHPDRGIVSPAQFIPVAEETGSIESIGRWVLHTACEQYSSWRAQRVAPERIAVNVSPVQIKQSGFVATVRAVLADTGLPPTCLELEITENLLLDNADEAIEKLKTLHAMGIRIAIDDFGTGYSSMSYLNRLSFDTLKIDRSFVMDLGNSEEAAAIVNAITAVAKSLNKGVIAEGVETQEQSDFLARMHCYCGQGKLFAMPMSARQFASFTRAWNRKKAS